MMKRLKIKCFHFCWEKRQWKIKLVANWMIKKRMKMELTILLINNLMVINMTRWMMMSTNKLLKSDSNGAKLS